MYFLVMLKHLLLKNSSGNCLYMLLVFYHLDVHEVYLSQSTGV